MCSVGVRKGGVWRVRVTILMAALAVLALPAGHALARGDCVYLGQLVRETYSIRTPNPGYQGSNPRCAFVKKTCLRGVLVGSFVDPKCREQQLPTPDEPEPKKEDCKFYGVNVREGESVTAFASDLALANGDCVYLGQLIRETYSIRTPNPGYQGSNPRCAYVRRTCLRGVLVGSFIDPRCRDDSPPLEDLVAGVGGGCVSEQRICKNGELTGSFTEPTCRVASLPVAASPF